ncbi:MAG: hypothetical protein ABH841_02875 [Candidatus Nealsonbacteria bacterium]
MKDNFDTKFFQKRVFEAKTISKYFRNAAKDLGIAVRSKEPEVIFNFSYSSLVKIGIVLIAGCDYRVKSRIGHHIKILEKSSQILNDENIEIIGDRMRKKRNLDLYEGGMIISQKEAKDYLNFTKTVIKKAEEYLKNQKSLF